MLLDVVFMTLRKSKMHTWKEWIWNGGKRRMYNMLFLYGFIFINSVITEFGGFKPSAQSSRVFYEGTRAIGNIIDEVFTTWQYIKFASEAEYYSTIRLFLTNNLIWYHFER